MAKSIKDLNIKGKKLFIRVDFNVPVKDGEVKDDTRIVEALKTIRFAKNEGAKVILASHLGRPKGERVPEMSLKPVAEYISANFFPCAFADDCIGSPAKSAIDALEDGDVVLLENLRYHKAEEKNLPDFAAELASLADVYVNDAFGACHRKHASTYGMAEIMSEKAAGFLVDKEIKYFEGMLKNTARPFGAIVGGAKVSDKIGVIESLMQLADKIFIGGAMAYTFLKHEGKTIGTSMVEEDQLSVVQEIYTTAKKKKVQIFLPVDHVISSEFNGAPMDCDDVNIPNGFMGLDIGKKSTDLYIEELNKCKTVLWNGPMGVFENPDYAKATFAIAEALGAGKATVVVGGGDSAAAVNQAGVSANIDHISTGGGASLEYIEFGRLPGVDILD
ncbi:MAG: phosphoglycerate kinase [Denitrovibrio sp.]|nr:MAG: phosphoglycerate kinase [Denitrovibrio sp.]